MNSNDHNRDEQRLADLLALAGKDAPPPDEDFLRRLRDRSAEVFAAQSAETIDSKKSPRRQRMLILAVRAIAASLAATILAVLALWNPPAGNQTALALGTALDKTAEAQTLKLALTRDGKTGEVLARQPQQLRWNEPDGTYKIARGPRTWLVDEKANRAASQAETYFRGEPGRLDLFALLGVPLEQKDRDRVLQAKPAERVQSGGKLCDLYRVELPWKDGKLRLEALVDPGTQFLQSLEVKTERGQRVEPLSKLAVVSLNQPVNEELFVVGNTLTEDGRIGKVLDLQGIVSVKPVMAQRFSPVDSAILLRPGDWVRTDIRGANAVRARLVPETLVTLGPGSLAELVSPKQIRLSEGEIKIVADKKTPVELLGPGQQKITVDGTQLYRVQNEKLVRVEKDPVWLRYFEGRSTNESIGSLVAKVDGRDEPLTVGYHKVTVDVRDQIARTVIEESFVNRTASRLEGIFYFPLPADASISGFGMWIGDKLVEADVVEKQRAREIYETILREKRDPGLLEWTGGNIFKARVFPIEAHSEKRITITYTQVLPLKGNRYRYQYALQSEMLKQHPLRELSIDVKINSAVPLASVTSPTHTARIDKAAHSAHVEFTAQEYTPTRDFEVVVEADGRQSDLVLIPHRRGDDGYFMLQLLPPGTNGGWQRDLLPDGEPMDLLILADTSASMDAASRATQQQLIAAVLASLTPKDKFNLAVCDVDAHWAFTQPQPAEAKNIQMARGILADRVSLGWSDLDKAFASALAKCGPKTRVVYVGDGIVTTGDGDPVAFSKRLKRLYEGKQGTFYAVAVGSSYEQIVLKTIASLGGGSMRQISGQCGPQTVARELLEEMVQPVIRDLKVEFRGLRTARVYPEELPNLAPGSQQILLGRYLPEGKDQSGEVIVTGTQSGKPVRFTTKVSLKDAELGNSFIPRLWARMHLDFLLQQGSSQAIQDEVIALSEEYNIITPYTSLLVLESDADRERFKVKTRFRMRDGEKFFAEGRDKANYDLVQQQMKRAGTWRIGLRRAVLQQLQALGRDARVFQPQQFGYGYYNRRGAFTDGSVYFEVGDGTSRMGGMGGSYGYSAPMSSSGEFLGDELGMPMSGSQLSSFSAGDLSTPVVVSEENFDSRLDLLASDKKQDFSGGGERQRMNEPAEPEDEAKRSADKAELAADEDGLEMAPAAMPARKPMSGPAASANTLLLAENLALHSRSERGLKASLLTDFESLVDGDENYIAGKRVRETSHMRYAGQPLYSIMRPRWENATDPFPVLSAPPGAEKELKKRWPPEARKIAESLLRTGQLAGLKDGLRFELLAESFDPRWGELTSRSENVVLVSPSAWLVHTRGDNAQTTVNWCDGKERGVLGSAFQLGRVRASTPTDLRKPPVEPSAYVFTSIERNYPGYDVTLKPQGEDRVLLVLSPPNARGHEIQVLVDTGRKVILSIESRQDGKVTSTTRFGDFVEVGGAWWAGRVEYFDEENRRTSTTIQKFQALQAGQFDGQRKEMLAGREQALFLHEPLPTLSAAKQALAAGKGKFEDHYVLMLHFQRNQQWDRVFEHLEKAKQTAAGKPGLRWVQSEVQRISRRWQEWKTATSEEASRLARSPAASPGASDAMFLAYHLLNQAGQGYEANETLALLDTLRPVFERQPAHVKAMKQWHERRADLLQQTGQWEPALSLRKQLAEQYPHDCSVHQRYAQALVEAGEEDAAFAWIAKVVTPDARWTPYEEGMLRDVVTNLMRSQGRYQDMADYLAAWVARNPKTLSPYKQYLSALVWADKLDEANTLMARWMNEVRIVERVPQRLPEEVTMRLDAAGSQALGQGHNLYTNRIEPRWLDPLADLALFLGRHDLHGDIADQIMNQWQFQQSDACRRVRKETAKRLRDETEKLSAGQIQRFVQWVWPNDPAVEEPVWKKIAAELRKRWEAEARPEIKHQLGATLVQVLGGRLGQETLLAFLRVQMEQGPEEYRTSYVEQLFNALLSQPWKAEYEAEAFTLLGKLSDAEDPIAGLTVQIAAVYRMTDGMVKARFDARMKAIEHPENLPRTELAAKRAENLKLAREGFADALREQMRKATAGAAQWLGSDDPGFVDAAHRLMQAEELARWMNIERLYLDVLTGRNLDKVEEECWEFLGAEPRKLAAEDDPKAQLDAVLQNRYLVTILNLAARKGAKPATVDRVLKYLERAIARDTEDVRWKLFEVQFLIALDRPKDLEKAIRAWMAAGDVTNRWRQALAYLVAEQGRLDEAIKLFEAIRAADELGPTDYRALANWYMAMNRREDYRRAMIAVYKTVDDWRLNNWLSQKLNPWQSGTMPLPSEMDQEILLVFAALFEKSSQPQQYLWQLRQYYQAIRDFRLLAGLADAVIGHTPGRVYPFLEGMRSVLDEVQDEATVDSMVQRIAEVRKRAKTTVDQRALDLLEVLVERRAAELKNQPGPHAQKALAALRRAFQREWSAGEPRLMADFLASLGRIAYRELGEEQVRELETLHRDAARGSIDRLHIAHALARAEESYNRRPRAIDLLQSALDEYQAAMNGVLPAAAKDALGTFIRFLEAERHFARGERVLEDQLKHPANRQQSYWLVQRLYELYESAIRMDGEVSLGSGLKLYRAVNQKLQAALDTPDDNHRAALINRLVQIYRTAHGKKLPGVIDDLRAFAFKRLPVVLKRQTNQYESIVSQTAHALHDLAGARDGLAFLIERIENEPGWFHLNNQDGWSRHGGTLAMWRVEVGVLGDLEPRLLKIVLKELRLDLESRQQRNREIYDRRYSSNTERFWAAKAGDFAGTAEEVLAENKNSSAAVTYVAEYLYWGLDRTGRAIEILLDAHKREVLDEAGESRLVDVLHQQGRYAESIAVLEPLIERRPDNSQYRIWLMRAYFQTKQQDKLLGLLKATHEYFHKENRWQEPIMAALAHSCLQNQLFDRSVEYFKEAISSRQRTAPRRGIGDGTLSSYYGYQAEAYAGLGDTAKAVEAAGGAIVSWGPRAAERANALNSLKSVLRRARDLDAYVAQLDKEAQQSGLQSPIVRKAIGQVYLEKGQPEKAIPQLSIAAELQPNDAETHKALIECFDRNKDTEGAIREILRSLELSRRDIKAYEDLGNRFKTLGKPEQSERAYTSIVEALPSESESHTLLAEILQRQNRWEEAVVQWEQVARIRALEPTGLVKLAEAQIRLKRWDEALQTLRKLDTRPWPPRFGDVHSQARQLERQVEDSRKRDRRGN